jgi:glycolate oxidase FAD binding subunit
MPHTDTENLATTLHSPAALRELVADATARKLAITDYGQAHTGLGHAAPSQHIALRYRCDNATGFIEHYLTDFTLRAHAGATLGQLRAALTPTNQFLPIDADDDLTLSEIINHHVYGPLRVGFGSIRDHLLGLAYIDGRGSDIRVGGRTVKNAAGLDVTRLMVGSLGELGLIHEATLRTYAIPEHASTVTLELTDPAAIDPLLPAWLRSDVAPAAIGMSLSPNDSTAARAFFTYLGTEKACQSQVRLLTEALAGNTTITISTTQSGNYWTDHDARAQRSTWRRSAPALLKIIVPPSTTGSVCAALSNWARQNATKNLRIDALPAHGVIFIGADLDVATAQNLALAATKLIAAAGVLVWVKRPASSDAAKLDELLPPFVPLPTEMSMLVALKQRMDPLNLLNPGRLIRP